MGIGIGSGALAATALIGGGGAVLHARGLNQRQAAFEQEMSKKPLADQNQWLRAGKPGMPTTAVPILVGGVGGALLGVTGLATMMNLGHATPLARAGAGIGAGLLLAAGVGAFVDRVG
jgi:hypothetical protein